MAVHLKGLDEVMKNLNREISNVEGRAVSGLYRAGLLIQGVAQTRVPVEYGHLRQSAYTRKSRDNPNAVEVGFAAAYALFVHENMEQKLRGQPRASGLGKYWGPKGQPKFLESAVSDNQDKIVEIIKTDAGSRK